MKQRFITLALIISFLLGFGMVASANETSTTGKTADKIKKENNTAATTKKEDKTNQSDKTNHEEKKKSATYVSKTTDAKHETDSMEQRILALISPEDKQAIKNKIDDLMKNESSFELRIYLSDSFLRKRDYKKALFSYKYFKNKYPVDYNEDYHNKLEFCMLYWALGMKKYSKTCFWDYYVKNFKYKPEYVEENFNEVLKEFDLYLFRYLFTASTWDMFPFARNEAKLQIKILLDNEFYDLSSESQKYFNDLLKDLAKEDEMFRKRRERIEFRRKQIDDYLRELERLLVLKDEQKLREFFEKYAEPKRVDFMVFKYRKFYFDRNFTKITFKVVPGSTNQKYPIKGYINDDVSIHCEIKTIPNTKDSDCPQRINTDSGYQYCRTFFRFKLQNKILIAY